MVIASARALLLDFDGPVCDMFAGYRPADVVSDIRRLLRLEPEPDEPATLADPMRLLRWIDENRPDLLERADETCGAAELMAVNGARPTYGADAMIASAIRSGRQIAIVSDNAEPAIRKYLDAQRLSDSIAVVVGRPYADPERMKPHPGGLLEAAERVGVAPQSCAFIGDSVSDMLAAKAARTPGIGYANKPDKRRALRDAGAELIIENIAELVPMLDT